MKNKTAIQRFEEKFERITESGCWIWLGADDGIWGYGRFYFGDGKYVAAHRAAWLFYNGEIKANLFVCHKCDNPSCVNQSHLFLGTNADNMRDMKIKGRGKYPFGENSHNAKLTGSEVLQFRSLRNNGESIKSLCNKFNIKKSMAYYIANGTYWKHLT